MAGFQDSIQGKLHSVCGWWTMILDHGDSISGPGEFRQSDACPQRHNPQHMCPHPPHYTTTPTTPIPTTHTHTRPPAHNTHPHTQKCTEGRGEVLESSRPAHTSPRRLGGGCTPESRPNCAVVGSLCGCASVLCVWCALWALWCACVPATACQKAQLFLFPS